MELSTPFQRTASFWNWLPAFRAVAEFGGVMRAADKLHTSASALSRTVKLLEESVGTPLFRRSGRSLVLTPAGEALLEATRLAMRGVHDATELEELPRGPLNVATTSRLTTVRLLPALRSLRQRCAGIVPNVTSVSHVEVVASLLSGAVDAAVTIARVAHRDLEVIPLTPAENAVYCGKGHPLWSAKKPSAPDVLAHPFAAPADAGSTTPSDGWPAHLERTVALHSAVLEPGVDACVRGELLAVLPAEIVSALAPTAALRALDAVAIPRTALFVVRRRPLSAARATARSIDALVAALKTS